MSALLPYPAAAFDRASTAALFCIFLPDPDRAVAELLRVVRPGGVVTAAVWDNYGGQLFSRIMWDVAGVLDPDLERPYFRPLNGPGELGAMWRASGFVDVAETNIMIRMDYAGFQRLLVFVHRRRGTAREICHGLVPRLLAKHWNIMSRRAFIGNRPDGPRSMTAVAWACRRLCAWMTNARVFCRPGDELGLSRCGNCPFETESRVHLAQSRRRSSLCFALASSALVLAASAPPWRCARPASRWTSMNRPRN